MNSINGQHQNISFELKAKTENNEELMVKYNDIIEGQKEFKIKYESLMNENNESQQNNDALNKKYNALKLTLVELESNLEAFRIKNDGNMLQIKTLDTEKTNLSENIPKITKERNLFNYFVYR